jgi:hypothetical protein
MELFDFEGRDVAVAVGSRCLREQICLSAIGRVNNVLMVRGIR